MLSCLIRNGTVVDGTGRPAFQADIAIEEDVIVEVGKVDETADRVIEADGLFVSPGFIDPHTHYDAQLFWDPTATPSCVHGVTSVIAGNCGLTLAPLRELDADYLRRTLARVEGMSLSALESGVPWDWESFPQYLDRLEGQIGVNAGFMIGHSALRLYVMGQAALAGKASREQLNGMLQVLAAALEAGGLGLSTSRSPTHTDGNGDPVPSRFASEHELLELCREVGRHDGTGIEAIVEGCIAGPGFTDQEVQLLASMSSIARRPLNWNVLNPDPATKERTHRQFEPSRMAEKMGGRVVALTMPMNVPQTQSFLTHCGLQMLPDWPSIFALPVPERIQRLRDPSVRQWMYERAKSSDAGVLSRVAQFENYVIGDTYSESNSGLSGQTVGDIARGRGQQDFDCLVDIVVNDELRTVLWPVRPEGDDVWKLRQEVWGYPDALIGGSDAGAHLDRMCGAVYTTCLLAEALRGRQVTTIERAIQMTTDEPARLFGLRRRGRIQPSFYADLVLFDPQRVGPGNPSTSRDLPGGSERLTVPSQGIANVFVNGIETVSEGRVTGVTPGTVLRSGRDTANTTLQRMKKG
jgi:N-acyl-D-aspartate/D-glutamate deacylase